MEPREMGEAIGKLYIDTMTRVAELIKDRPTADVVRPQLEALKEEAITKLVAFGHQRKTLSEADQGTVDNRMSATIDRIPMDVFSTFSAAAASYAGTDFELHRLATSFNIITQYANFELLALQEPEEAKRLGVA